MPALLLLCMATALVAILSLLLGDVTIAPSEFARVLSGAADASPQAELILMEFRLPRILLGLLIGGALATAGTIAQAGLRNPLAEPGLLGINSGAALAAVIVLLQWQAVPTGMLPLYAFGGALFMCLLILIFASIGGAVSLRIILVGIGLNAMAGAIASFLSLLGDIRAVQQAMVWMAGSLHHAGWPAVAMMLWWLPPSLLLAMLAARELQLLRFGDDTARSLGLRTGPARALLMLLCALISAIAVSAVGIIAFVGLVAPHLARQLAGHDMLRLLPTAFVYGALLLCSADLLGRLLLAPVQLPAGLVTAILGTPFFFYLLWRNRQH